MVLNKYEYTVNYKVIVTTTDGVNEVERIYYIDVGVEITSEEYLIDEENMLIRRVMPKTTVEEFRSKLEIRGKEEGKIKEGEREVTDKTEWVKTGMKIKFETGEKEYTIVVVGDVDKNGDTNIIDMLRVNGDRLEIKKLEGKDMIAAGDVNEDGKIDYDDVMIINEYRVLQDRERLKAAINNTTNN